jgi:hypothetical protein
MQRSLGDLFVDRSQHTNAFCRMLDGRAKRHIMLIEADSGMGKSWLLHTLAHETKTKGLPLVHIDFADRQIYDTLMLVRRCRDAIGSEHFSEVTQAINDVTTPRVTILPPSVTPSGSVNVSVGNENTLTKSSISVSDVGNTTFRDNYFSIQTNDPLVRQAFEDRINTAFFECLTRLCLRTTVVFLFDTYERNSLKSNRWLSRSADRWIYDQLLLRIHHGLLDNVIVVLAGRHLPKFGAEWHTVMGRKSLDQFGHVDVKEYLCSRLGLSAITDDVIARLWQVGANIPETLGLFGDRLLQSTESKLQDDEW